MNKNKTAKGIDSLGIIVILLSSVLAVSLFYNNNITANVIGENFVSESKFSQIIEVDNIRELNQLNEGWYQIRNGFVFYLEHFDSEVPLWIRVRNNNQQNGMFDMKKNHLQDGFFSDEF